MLSICCWFKFFCVWGLLSGIWIFLRWFIGLFEKIKIWFDKKSVLFMLWVINKMVCLCFCYCLSSYFCIDKCVMVLSVLKGLFKSSMLELFNIVCRKEICCFIFSDKLFGKWFLYFFKLNFLSNWDICLWVFVFDILWSLSGSVVLFKIVCYGRSKFCCGM